MTALGWSYDEVRHGLDLPRLRALSRLWKVCPPANIVLRDISQMLGAKYDAPASEKPRELSGGEIGTLLSAGFPLMSEPPNDPMLDFVR